LSKVRENIKFCVKSGKSYGILGWEISELCSSTFVVRFLPCYNVTIVTFSHSLCAGPHVYRSGALYARRFSQSTARRNRQTPPPPLPFRAEHCFRCKALCSKINPIGEVNGYISNFKASLIRYYALHIERRSGDCIAIDNF